MTYVIAAFNQYDKNAVVYTACKQRKTLHKNLDKALNDGATIISIRKLLPKNQTKLVI